MLTIQERSIQDAANSFRTDSISYLVLVTHVIQEYPMTHYLYLLLLTLILCNCVAPIAEIEISEDESSDTSSNTYSSNESSNESAGESSSEYSSSSSYSSSSEPLQVTDSATDITVAFSAYSIVDTFDLKTEGEFIANPDTEKTWYSGSLIITAEDFYTEVAVTYKDSTIQIDLDPINEAANFSGVVYHQSYSAGEYCYSDSIEIIVYFDDDSELTVMTDSLGRYSILDRDTPIKEIKIGVEYEDYSYSPQQDTICFDCSWQTVTQWFNFTPEEDQTYMDLTYIEPEIEMNDAPYIYLYPEVDMTVSVTLQPRENVSIYLSEPLYGTGWTVDATPKGLIDNTYDFLFYELALPTKEKNISHGWTLKREIMEQQLDTLLANYSLNTHEVADFKDFWRPYFQASPYYTFFPQDMNRYTGITITPTPDAIRRVLFYIEPSEQPLPVLTPEYPETFERTGFTVVEWGVLNYHSVLRGID